MKTQRNYFQHIVSIFLCLLFSLNTLLIRPFQSRLVASCVTVQQTTEQVETPETVVRVNNYDSSLIDAQEKYNAVASQVVEEQDITLKIFGMICATVEYMLEDLGFEVFEAQAYDLDNDVWYNGYIYTDYALYSDNYIIAGFVAVDNELNLTTESNLIAFNNDETDENIYLIQENELELFSDHFIVEDKYVTYNWKNCFLVNYSIADNYEQNYNYELGRLFSYDERKYVYDNDFTYTVQEVSMMFSEIDFDNLQQTINEINAEQAKNGYYVQEITITYIDYELIEEWERCSDKDSFYGYDLEELNKLFDPSTTLEFTSDGVKQAALIEEPKPTNWLKAGLMILGGCAAILIGAALAPLTGGCSFGASLLCIVKLTAVALVTDLLIQTTVSTITNVINGQNFWDALDNSIASTFTVENIASAFMMSAIMSAVMVGSGLVKACFVEGTPVLTENGYQNIETLEVGDKVLSYSELTGAVAVKEITETMVNKSNDICSIALDSGETITSTSLHPWYVQGKGWTPAYALTSSDKLLTESGAEVRILGVNRQILEEAINVYNISVDEIDSGDYHTYYVGSDSVLVHNACTTPKNNKPVEKHHMLTNKSKKWTPEFKKITDKYNLDLNGKWNIESMAHRGRHATEYHKYMLDNVKEIHKVAKGNQKVFLDLFEGLKKTIMNNDGALYKAFWKFGGTL